MVGCFFSVVLKLGQDLTKYGMKLGIDNEFWLLRASNTGWQIPTQSISPLRLGVSMDSENRSLGQLFCTKDIIVWCSAVDVYGMIFPQRKAIQQCV